MKNQVTRTTPEIIHFLIANPTLSVVFGASEMPASEAVAILLEDKYKPLAFQTGQSENCLHIWGGFTTLTVESILALGPEKIAQKAACISANYVIYMNGGMRGYTFKDIKAIEEKKKKIVLQDVKTYAKSILASINGNPANPTDAYLQRAHKEWFAGIK